MVNNPDAVSDEVLLAAVRRAIEAEETDPRGGVSPAAVARYCPLAESTVRVRLARLAAAGRLRVVWGFGPTKRPRRSYRPDESDRTEDESDRPIWRRDH